MKFLVGGVGGRDAREIQTEGEEDAVREYLDAAVVERAEHVGVYVRRSTEPQWMAYVCALRGGRWEVSFAFEVPLGVFQRVPAAEDAIRAAKANVRDACATACAEVLARQSSDRFGEDYLAREKVAEQCVDAIAALDLEAL